MGFQHCELNVLGHLHRTRPLNSHRSGMSAGSAHAASARMSDGIKLWAAETPEAGAAQTCHSALPVAWHNSTWIADRTIGWLKEARKKGKPFCAWVSFPDPHHPFDCPEPWSSMYDPRDMLLPRHRVRDLERRPWWHKAVLEGTATRRPGNAEIPR
jgi:arylsulfatase A-like enzyme